MGKRGNVHCRQIVFVDSSMLFGKSIENGLGCVKAIFAAKNVSLTGMWADGRINQRRHDVRGSCVAGRTFILSGIPPKTSVSRIEKFLKLKLDPPWLSTITFFFAGSGPSRHNLKIRLFANVMEL
jgi:hypothetical protein